MFSEPVVKDGYIVNPQRVAEHQFLKELEGILHSQYDDIDINTYYNTSKFFELVKPTLQLLRFKYGLDENPPDTNSILVLFLSSLNARQADTIKEE